MANAMTSDDFIKYATELSASGQNISYNVVPAAEDETSDTLRKVRINILDKETGDAVEEVDVLTSADSVIFDNGRTLPEELNILMQYTNSTPTPVAIGGIPEGSTFTAVDLQEMFTRILYPYTKPNVNISLSTSDTYFEQNVNISPVIVTIKIEKKSEPIKSAELYVGGNRYTVISDVPSQGGTITASITTPIMSSTEIYVKVNDGRESYDSNRIKLIFNHPIYIGVVNQSADINSALIKGLSSNIQYTNKNDISITKKLSPIEQCFMVAYRSQYAGAESVTIYDTNGFNITNSFEVGSVDVLDGSSNLVKYTYMRSNVTTQTSFDITVKIKA